ncbi:glycoside hydrolase family 20, partial [Flavobacteriaceae bacterium]|nr:glycoside hydrolase family 20 [Flavobacteriaceae bacterium]
REGNIDEIKSFAVNSSKRNLDGLLLTLWDDDSPHFELYKRGIAAFAEYTWAGEQRSKAEFKAVYRHRNYGAAFVSETHAFIDDLDIPVGAWVNVLLNDKVHRNSLMKKARPIEEEVIDLPNPNSKNKGEWSRFYSKRLMIAKENSKHLNAVAATIATLQKGGAKNQYTLDIYAQVVALSQFSFNTLLTLEVYDQANTPADMEKALKDIQLLSQKFDKMRNTFESVYSKTRILNKPTNYILDQDHHNHPANQTVNFDWQFYAEILFLEKVNQHFGPYL